MNQRLKTGVKLVEPIDKLLGNSKKYWIIVVKFITVITYTLLQHRVFILLLAAFFCCLLLKNCRITITECLHALGLFQGLIFVKPSLLSQCYFTMSHSHKSAKRKELCFQTKTAAQILDGRREFLMVDY